MAQTVFDTLLYCLCFFYGLILLGSIGLYGWRLLSRGVRASYTQKLFECLQPQDHLPSMVFPEIEYAFNRRVLIHLLTRLAPMLEGVEGRILRLIIHDNGLDRQILQDCRYHDDYRKVESLSVFIETPIPEAMMNELHHFLDSPNNELRMVTLLVWLNQEPAQLIERLAGYPHELSDRDCANIYALAQRRNIPVTGVEALTHSPNPSVVRFGRRALKLNGM
ncbi:MAG: hypothetical protein LBM20_03845 [Rikenellaceae bacterium]|jgi:hypothetical protein|nr:hypothetical protein [Rikenellaceae bacterium]